jgi:hypothetical protein
MKVAFREAGTPLSELTESISCRSEHGSQFSVNCLRAKTFEKEEFDDESLIRFFHLAK